MTESKTLDRLIMADVLLALLSVAWSAAAEPPRPSGPAFVLWILVCATTVGAWIGLLSRLRPARALYAASWLGYLALVGLRGGGAGSSIDALLDLAAGLVGGMILALVYFSDLRTQFHGLGGEHTEPVPAG
jgi:hypothetical protein